MIAVYRTKYFLKDGTEKYGNRERLLKPSHYPPELVDKVRNLLATGLNKKK